MAEDEKLAELPELATVGTIAKLNGLKPHQVHYQVHQGRLVPIAVLRVGEARWPLYDVRVASETLLGRSQD